MNKAFIVAVKEETGGLESIFNIPVFYCGVGKINSTIKTLDMINSGVDEIINIGSCGSDKYPLGTILKIGKVFQDIDGTPICDYGHTPFENDSESIILSNDSEVTCFTTDYFFDVNQKEKYSMNYLNKIYESSVVDMECFSIAKVCKLKGVKFSSFKWVSDSGGFDDWIRNCKIGLKNFETEFLKNI